MRRPHSARAAVDAAAVGENRDEIAGRTVARVPIAVMASCSPAARHAHVPPRQQPAADSIAQASPLPDPTASPCASSLYAKLCDTIPSVSSVLFPARWAVATRLSPGRGQAVPVPDKPEAGIRGHSDSADVAGGSVLAGDHHVHLSVDSVDDVFELGYILLQRIDVG